MNHHHHISVLTAAGTVAHKNTHWRGLYCHESLDKEVSKYVGVSLAGSSIGTSIETLRSINSVSVATSTGSGCVVAELGFVLQKFSYDVTFFEATMNSSGIAIFDGSPFTWNIETKNLQYSGSTEEIIDVPLLIPVTDRMNPGWAVNVQPVRDGFDERNGTTVQVQIALNGQDYSDDEIYYDYIPETEIYSIVPTHGPATGGTEIVIRGKNFIKSSALACRFGDSEVMVVPVAYYINSTMIICISPPSYFEKATLLKVSNNRYFIDDVDLSLFRSGADEVTNEFASISYSYDTEIEISALSPPLGPTSGNFSVQVSGGPFNQTDELRCKFGDVSVQAFLRDVGSITCYAPPYAAGVYPFELSINDQDYTSSRKPFFYYSDPALSRIFPTSGPAVAAGTQVNVYGAEERSAGGVLGGQGLPGPPPCEQARARGVHRVPSALAWCPHFGLVRMYRAE